MFFSMKFYYFVDKERVRKGPLPIEDLQSYEITPNTLVWCKGMKKWSKAKDVEELAHLFESTNNKNESDITGIKCIECGYEVSDKAKKCPNCGYLFVQTSSCPECGEQIPEGMLECLNCGCPTTEAEGLPIPQDIQQAEPVYYEEDDGGKPHKWLYVIIALLLIILACGSYYVFYYNHQKQEAEDREKFVKDSINQARQDSINQVRQDSIKGAKLAKDEITNNLKELFDVVKNQDEYDARFFSSDFNKIYNEVSEIDELINQGYIGFWDAGFWSEAQDGVNMNIVVNDVYSIKDNEAMAKVKFIFTFEGSTETKIEEIKVIRENGKWVLDDVHGYKKQMKAYIKDNANHHIKDDNSVSEDMSWINGNWRYQMEVNGQILEFRVGISGETIVVFLNGRHHYTGRFTIEGDHIVYNRHNGMSEYIVIDRNQRLLKADNYHYMQRF